MKEFKVSIIIPNFNNEKYIKECIDSVLSQTYPIEEIIVYDDCSTDKSREILKLYEEKNSNVRIIYGMENKGVSFARHTAIMESKSDYICVLDSDDFFYDINKIKNEMSTVNEYYDKYNRKIIAFSQTINVNEEGEKIGDIKKMDLSKFIRFKIVTRKFSKYMPRDYCFPKEYYIACGGYREELSLYEDWDLNLKMLNFTEFIFSGGYGTAYRQKNGGLSSVEAIKHYKSKKNVFNINSNSLKYSVAEKVTFKILASSAYLKKIFIK